MFEIAVLSITGSQYRASISPSTSVERMALPEGRRLVINDYCNIYSIAEAFICRLFKLFVLPSHGRGYVF
jgi:hypothetical protein